MSTVPSFRVGDRVAFKGFPNLKGVVVGIMPSCDDIPQEISVDIFIPSDEPGFVFVNCTENFLCGPEDLVECE